MDTRALDTLTPFSPEEVQEAKGLKEVWIGLTRDCPIARHRIVVCLTKESFSIVRDDDGTPVMDGSGLSKTRDVDGAIERLTADQIRHIVSRSMKIVLRTNALADRHFNSGDVKTGRKTVHAIKTYADLEYSPKADDVLLSDYVYILPPDRYGAHRGAKGGRIATITTNGVPTIPEWLELGDKPKKRGPGRPRKDAVAAAE